jgi:predicted lipoprotein
MKKGILILGLTGMILSVFMTGCVTIVKQGEEATLTNEVVFDAGTNVADIWESAALPELEGKAVDLGTLLTEADGDIEALADKYGKRAQGAGSSVSFTVKGDAKVESVFTESAAGYMVITVDGYTGKTVLKLQTGSVFKGTAVRDSLDIIKFNDYKNQVDYAAVSTSIHDTIKETVYGNIDVKTLEGKPIAFIGCFTFNNNEELIITPVVLTIKEGA